MVTFYAGILINVYFFPHFLNILLLTAKNKIIYNILGQVINN